MSAAPAEAQLCQPEALTLIFEQLPLDARLRCAEVCRAWRAVAQDARLWLCLDLSPGSGVTAPRTAALLEAALRRAGRTLQTLDVSGCAALAQPLIQEEAAGEAPPLLALLRRYGQSLRTLRIARWQAEGQVEGQGSGCLTWQAVGALCAAAPALTELSAHVRASTPRDADAVAAAIRELAGALRPPLASLHLHGIEAGLRSVALLGRADDAWPANTEAALELLLDALRVCGLRELHLTGFGLLEAPERAAAVVRAACAAGTLESLCLNGNGRERYLAPRGGEAVFGAALAAALPTLRRLEVRGGLLGDVGLQPLFAALSAAPTALPRLAHLDVGGNALTASFCDACVLPAALGAPSLTRLVVAEPNDAARRANEAVWRRSLGPAPCSALLAPPPLGPVFGAVYSRSDVQTLAQVTRGAGCRVFRARCVASGATVALKRLNHFYAAADYGTGLGAECVLQLALLVRLSHPNIAQLHGVQVEDRHGKLLLVREFGPQVMNDVLRAEQPVPLPRLLALAAQLSAAVAHCHAAGVLHCCLNPKAVLVGPGDALQLAGFSTARIAKQHPAEEYARTYLWYVAPEQLVGAAASRAAMDVWALGCLVAELYMGAPLAAGDNQWTQLLRIGDVCGSAVASGWAAAAHIPDFRRERGAAPGRRVRETLRAARPDLAGNAGAEALIQLVDSLLVYDPALRPTAADAAAHPAFAAFRATRPPPPRASAAAADDPAAGGSAPDGAQGSTAARVPLLSAAQLEASPARRDGMSAADEAVHHRHVVALVRALAAAVLASPASSAGGPSEQGQAQGAAEGEREAIVATACVYTLRFYAVHSRALRLANPALPAAAAALLLACKARERTPELRCGALVRAVAALQRGELPPPEEPAAADDADDAGEAAHALLDVEWRMAGALCFQFCVDTPGEWLARARRRGGGGMSAAQLSAAEAALEALEATDAALRHAGATLAACVLALAVWHDAPDVRAACAALGVRVPAAPDRALADVAAALEAQQAAPPPPLLPLLAEVPPAGVPRHLAEAPSPYWWPPRRRTPDD
jgi:hypothetical protein